MSALNVFKTVTANLTTTSAVVYTAPATKSSIVLMAQISNVSNTTANATVTHVNTANVETELIKQFGIPGNDAASATTGKLVLEEGTKLKVSAGEDGKLKIVLSILETSN
jgi:hypothetical protein